MVLARCCCAAVLMTACNTDLWHETGNAFARSITKMAILLRLFLGVPRRLEMIGSWSGVIGCSASAMAPGFVLLRQPAAGGWRLDHLPRCGHADQ